MKFLASLRSLTAKFFHRAQLSNEMDQELRSHIELRADDLERSGLPRAEAERRARIEFGSRERFKEEAYQALGGNFIEIFLQDIRFSLRVLRKAPGFTIAAVVTLAVAIGANSVVFGVLNALILRPLNVPQAQSLYAVQRGTDPSHSYPDYLDLRDRNHTFDSLAAYDLAPAGLDIGKNVYGAWVQEVTGNYFDVLRIQPYLGRFFHGTDEHGPNSAPYIVLPWAFWHAHFQDDRGVVGRVVQLNKHPFTILGVAPPGFRGNLAFLSPDFWVPIVNQEQVEGVSALNDRGNQSCLLMVLGHLKPGVTPAQAIADLNPIGLSLEKAYPKDDAHTTFTLARPGLAGDWFGRPLTAFLAGMLLLSGLILLAACANLGSLFAARAADRGREVALRLALGSSRRRILRQVFTEAILISLAGGTVGLLGSVALLRGLSAWSPLETAPIKVPVYPDVKVYLVALLLALVSGFLFGAVPVRQVLRTNPYELIKSGSNILAGRIARRITVRDVLLVAQIAICAVLVTSSFVAVRGLVRSLHSNFGFEPHNAMLVGTVLTMAGYNGDKAPAMEKRIIDALGTIPGVQSVGSVDRPPLHYGAYTDTVFTGKTADLRQSNAAADAAVYKISPGYFDAARTTLLSGRAFTWHDDKNSPRVAVVNRQFAIRLFGSTTNALDGYFKLGDGARIQVVGIVEDGKYASLTEAPRPAMFLPILQSPTGQLTIVLRSNRDPQQLTAAVKSTMRTLDPGLPFDMSTWSQELNDAALFASRAATVSLGVLGIMGAMLAITGIFGMAAYSVSKRLRELGIRIALGAQRAEVLQAALGRAFKLLALGSAAGLVLGLLATKVLAVIVYKASPRDPLVLAGAVLAMSLLGLLATWIPAQRALSVNPLILLRED